MTERIEIRPSGPIQATVRPPGSKSITNRALVCAALANGQSTLTGALDSDDTRVMVEALRQLGLSVDHDPLSAAIRIFGCGGRVPAARADLFVGNSGTTMRFLTALVTVGHGVFRLDGTPRMRERPIGDLLGALRQLGVDVASEAGTSCPPVLVQAKGLPGGRAEISGGISSQYLSGLLMAAPYAERPVELVLRGPLVSQPYVHMTLGVMAAFGVSADTRDLGSFLIPIDRKYQGRLYEIEPDASAASYFFAAAAIAGGQVTVQGLSRESMQGDVGFCECLKGMGCEVKYGEDSITVRRDPAHRLHGIDVDMNAISDTVQTLAPVALLARGPTTITGVAHIRHKETDRLRALATELRRLGAQVEELDDGLRILPDGSKLHGAELRTYDDHRMAMGLALVGLVVPGVVILDPGCTGKTYPGYFADLENCRG